MRSTATSFRAENSNRVNKECAKPENWQCWRWQIKNSIKDLRQLQPLLNLAKEEIDGCYRIKSKLQMSITPYYFDLIDRNNPNCPIRKQVIPTVNESLVDSTERADPVGEEKAMAVPGLVHRYPDRVLFLVTNFCASYCRYCTRSRMVSGASDYDFNPNYSKALDYIAGNKNIRDVLISGGDPLLLQDRMLDGLLSKLRAIPHVEFIRIGTRIPTFLPQRITDNLCSILDKHGPLFMSIHVNHPKECTKELFEACQKLLSARVVLGCQSVLLKGINDDDKVMRSLCHKLLQMGVRPYYLYLCDLIEGSKHLRTSVSKGIEIIERMRGHTTGYAIPQLVIDAPNGGGKIPINPNYVEGEDEEFIYLRNYENKIFTYPLHS